MLQFLLARCKRQRTALYAGLTGVTADMVWETQDWDVQDYTKPYISYPTRVLYLTRGIERMLDLGTHKQYPKHYVLATPEQVPDVCYLIVRGRVAAYETTRDGIERIYNYMDSGSLILDLNMLTRRKALVYFQTVQPSELVSIRRETLLRAMTENPEIMMDIVESISNKCLSAMDQVREVFQHNAPWRICQLFLIFADRYGVIYDGKILIKEKISQQMIANLLCINRVTAARAIKDLKELNLIEQINGYYCIRDVEKLHRHQEVLDELNAYKP